MKKHLIASLILSSLTSVAFALPGEEQPPLTELRQSSAPATVAESAAAYLPHNHLLAENGASRGTRRAV